jgi:hypothetical protein
MHYDMLVKQNFTDKQGNVTEYALWRLKASQSSRVVRYRMAFTPNGSLKPIILHNNCLKNGQGNGVRQLMADFKKDIARWKRKQVR